MKKQRTIILFAGCIIGIIIWLVVSISANRAPIKYSDRIMGIYVSEAELLSKLDISVATANDNIYFEGTKIAYDSLSNSLLVPQNPDKPQWEGIFSVFEENKLNKGKLYLYEDTDLYDKEKALRESHNFSLLLVLGNQALRYNLVFTGAPLINITTTRMEPYAEVDVEEDPDTYYFESRDKYYGEMTLFNPNIATNHYEIIESYLSYNEKGDITLGAGKASYSIKLMDKKGKNQNISLLGMREDNSWKLNAMYMDVNRIREKSASDIWEEFADREILVNEKGPKEEYVEVVLDNEYLGLYCMVEPIDTKKLELGKEDVLYKLVSFDIPTSEDFEEALDNEWKYTKSIRIRYPKEDIDYEKAWGIIQEYIEYYFGPEGDEKYINEEFDYDEALSHTYIENLSDITMFFMVTTADDNNYKNMYYVADVDSTGNYKMRKIPWDVDRTFGNRYDNELPHTAGFNPEHRLVKIEFTFEQFYNANKSEVGNYVNNRWKLFRQSFLSTDYILDILKNNRDYVVSTGAHVRESQRWPDFVADMDIDYLIDYQEKRMAWLDEYFEGLAN